MKSHRILVQVNTSFDFYILTALVRDKRNTAPCDLLIPFCLLNKIPKYYLDAYKEIDSFEPKLKNLLSFRSIVSTLRLSRWARKRKNNYTLVLLGSYRDAVTSLLAKWFHNRARLITIKQGVDRASSNYFRVRSLRYLHDCVYYSLFGYSAFYFERLNQEDESGSYIFDRPVWKSDPFDASKDVFTIGKGAKSGESQFVYPNLSLFSNGKQDTRSGVLVIGERTPMTPSWNSSQDRLLNQAFSIIMQESIGQPIFLRARKNLTNIGFYKSLNPVFLDPEQPYDDQLLQLNPRIVVSVKSTAVKISSFYGFDSYLLYPSLNFRKNEVEHLKYLFEGGSAINYVTDLEEFRKLISDTGHPPPPVEKYTSAMNQSFYDRLNESRA